jgi:hypothetical protein
MLAVPTLVQEDADPNLSILYISMGVTDKDQLINDDASPHVADL